jgi:hypothetical protein
MIFRPNQRVFYRHFYAGKTTNLPGTIVEEGLREGTWRVRLDNHALTITATEGDLIPMNERDY